MQSIKIQNTKTNTNQEIQQLQEQTKLSELKQKRGKFIQKVLDDIFEENSFQVDQATIDEHYNETDEEIIKWAHSLKLEQTGYLYKSEINYREERLLIPVKDNEIYQKVKKYALALDLTDLLYFLIEYPTFNYDAIRPEVEEELLRPALGSPAISEYEYSEKEIEQLQLALSWKKEEKTGE